MYVFFLNIYVNLKIYYLNYYLQINVKNFREYSNAKTLFLVITFHSSIKLKKNNIKYVIQILYIFK